MNGRNFSNEESLVALKIWVPHFLSNFFLKLYLLLLAILSSNTLYVFQLGALSLWTYFSLEVHLCLHTAVHPFKPLGALFYSWVAGILLPFPQCLPFKISEHVRHKRNMLTALKSLLSTKFLCKSSKANTLHRGN